MASIVSQILYIVMLRGVPTPLILDAERQVQKFLQSNFCQYID